MAAIMLTRQGVTGRGGPLGWQVSYKGVVLASYVEQPNGGLLLAASSMLDQEIRNLSGAHGTATIFFNLTALREAYLRGVQALEAKARRADRARLS